MSLTLQAKQMAMEDLLKKAKEKMAHEQWDAALELWDRLYKEDPENTEVLEQRAEVYHKLNRLADAINDLNRYLKILPGDEKIKARKELLQTILKNSQLDIYACTNTHLDPWA